MTTLALCPKSNSPGRYDATGAFIPEARSFVAKHGGELFLFDNTKGLGDRMRESEVFLGQYTGARALAVFSHGWRDGIQPGWRKGQIYRLAASIRKACTPDPVIALYCCDTARDGDNERDDDTADGPGGEGGFADMLRHELLKIGVRGTVFAHTTEGHTTVNPFVRRFEPQDVAGGDWIVAPRSPLWRAWRTALKTTDLRLRFPFMTQAEIEAELHAPQRVA